MGRDKELALIHNKLNQQNNAVAISAVAGMGGVGKTELAVKYSRQHENDYPGGVCWFGVRESNIAAEIITFAKNYLKLEVPQKDFQEQPLTLKQQVDWCWSNWRPLLGLVLVVFDDVTDIDNFGEYLPTNSRFCVLITTRLRNLDTNIKEIPLDVLSLNEALQLLRNIIEESRVNKELETAQELCKWLGYLPLGIELVGRYIKAKNLPSFTLKEMLDLLQKQRLQQEALNPKHKTLSTTELGVSAAFELSWLELDSTTQQVAVLLSLFASSIFAREWVEFIVQSFQKINTRKFIFERFFGLFMPWHKKGILRINYANSDINAAIEQLYQHNLINCLEEKYIYYYKIHPLIRQFLQIKLSAYKQINNLKIAFANSFIDIAESIPTSVDLNIINSVKNAIPHLVEVAENLTDVIIDEKLDRVFVGLVRFYSGQGLYALAEHWCEQSVSLTKSRLGETHHDFAYNLYGLADNYISQGKYEKAEPICIQACELTKDILGENHPHYIYSLSSLASLYKHQAKYEESELIYIKILELAGQTLGKNHIFFSDILNDLALLYKCQGKYEEAEPLYIQALDLTKSTLGENHHDYAASLNNLAALYHSQERYKEAEPLLIQALELTKRVQGDNHPNYASCLNNLASFYSDQKKYEEAESLYIQALELIQGIFGENHPDFALMSSNVAYFYYSQGKYDEAEPLHKQALELRKRILGENHPDYTLSLNNLAEFYDSQGKYDEAEPLYKQVLELYKRLSGENHPDYARSLNNLALLYYSLERYDEAEPLYIQALKIAELSSGTNHPSTITIRNNLERLRNHL